jgi:hypothetical protein
MEMLQTHCYATGTVTLLWKCYKLVVMQQTLLRYYRNATGCIDHVTKENLICHNMIIFVCRILEIRVTVLLSIIVLHLLQACLFP